MDMGLAVAAFALPRGAVDSWVGEGEVLSHRAGSESSFRFI